MENSENNYTASGSIESLIAEISSVIPSATEYLRSACDGICRQIDPEVDSYLRQQLDCMINVANDAAFLTSHRRFNNISALCRLAFESRIHFFSAIRIEGYVARKYIKQTTEHIAALKAMTSDSVLAVFATEELKRNESYLQTLQRHYDGIPTRQWNLKEASSELGLLAQYNERYTIHSQAIHSTPAGLMTKDDSYIVAFSMVRLLSDIISTIEFTICPSTNGVDHGPLSAAWEKIFPFLPALIKHESDFSDRFNRFSTMKLKP